jgi:hypothetical protein
MAGDYTSWHVGMKVVCIACRPDGAPADAFYPEIDRIYTLREIRDDAPWRYGKTKVVVLLNELDNSHFVGRAGYWVEPGFDPRGFRPVQTRKTDISVFEKMLRPIDAKLKETV